MTLLQQERVRLDLGWVQGDAASFALRFVGQAALATQTWTAQIRRGSHRDDTLYAAFDVTVVADVEDCVVTLALQPTASDEWSSDLWWDLESSDGSSAVRTWVGGQVKLTRDTTHG